MTSARIAVAIEVLARSMLYLHPCSIQIDHVAEGSSKLARGDAGQHQGIARGCLGTIEATLRYPRRPSNHPLPSPSSLRSSPSLLQRKNSKRHQPKQ